MSEEPIYKFEGLKRLLTDMGYHVEKASPYKPITNPIEVGIKELTKSFKFSEDGIFYIDELGEERQVFMYKRNYHLKRFGKPRYHICKCETIEQFIASGSFEREYRASNADAVPVADMDNDYNEETIENLPICKYCQRKMAKDRAINSTEFVGLLKNAEEYNNKNQSLFGDSQQHSNKIDVDIFGYTRDWEEISQKIREQHNYTCEQCGVHVEEMSDHYYIHVHHLNGNKADNRIANLKCLCIRCHSRVDDRHKHNFSRGANKAALDDFNQRYPETDVTVR